MCYGFFVFVLSLVRGEIDVLCLFLRRVSVLLGVGVVFVCCVVWWFFGLGGLG